MKRKANPKAIHIAKSHNSQPHKPKLGNKYVFANAERDANKIEKNGKNEGSTGHNKGYT